MADRRQGERRKRSVRVYHMLNDGSIDFFKRREGDERRNPSRRYSYRTSPDARIVKLERRRHVG